MGQPTGFGNFSHVSLVDKLADFIPNTVKIAGKVCSMQSLLSLHLGGRTRDSRGILISAIVGN